MSTENNILSIKNIEVIYDHVILVLKGVSLDVPKGGIVALLGANGAGKTTTIKSISNILKTERGEVTKGSISFEGNEIQNLSPTELVKRGVVQVMEGRHCFEHLTVEENLFLGAYSKTKVDREILTWVYDLFPRLKERKAQLAGTLSGGEQQMLAIGRALMSEPEFLLLDEPSLGIAPILVKAIFSQIRKIAETGVTVLLVEQNARAALKLADRGYVLEVGKIVYSGTSEELLSSKRIQEAYLGKQKK